jgi:hypothetical protein
LTRRLLSACLAGVWDECKSLRDASFDNETYREALIDCVEGLTISTSEAMALSPRKLPRESFMKIPVAEDDPVRYFLKDVYIELFKHFGGMSGK